MSLEGDLVAPRNRLWWSTVFSDVAYTQHNSMRHATVNGCQYPPSHYYAVREEDTAVACRNSKQPCAPETRVVALRRRDDGVSTSTGTITSGGCLLLIGGGGGGEMRAPDDDLSEAGDGSFSIGVVGRLPGYRVRDLP